MPRSQPRLSPLRSRTSALLVASLLVRLTSSSLDVAARSANAAAPPLAAVLAQGRELRRLAGAPGALRAAGFFEAAVAAAAPDAEPLELAQLLEEDAELATLV